MAIRDTADLPGAIRSTDILPNTRVVLRCIGEKFETSKSSGNEMISREWEVIDPEIIIINGQNKCLGGTKVMQYLPVLCYQTDGKTRDDYASNKALARYRDENKVLGLEHEKIDDENPALMCKGLIADGTLGAERFNHKELPTPEQLALGIRVGTNKVDSAGNPEIGYRVKLVGIAGLSTVVTNKAF